VNGKEIAAKALGITLYSLGIKEYGMNIGFS